MLDAILYDDDSSLLTAKDFPVLAAFKRLFFDSYQNSPDHPMRLITGQSGVGLI